MAEYGDIIGTGTGLSQYYINNPQALPSATVAEGSGLMSQYWAGAAQASPGPGMGDLQNTYGNLYNQVGGLAQNPANINLPQNFSFQPGQLNFNNPFAGGTPQVSPSGGVSGSASSYQVTPQQVWAMQVSAPGAIAPISGLQQVYAPQLQNFQMGPAQTVTPQGLQQFQMGPAQNVNAPTLQQYQMGPAPTISGPTLQNYSMQAAGPVAPTGQVGTPSWTDPSTAAQFMSPYTQQVVGVQEQQAQLAYQQQLEQQRGQASAAGAFGGEREGVEEANEAIGLQQQMAQIQATGLQNAYTQGQQQFNTQLALGLQGQQFNVQTGLQAALANQQAQQQANVQNLASRLQTQGLDAQTAMQVALANQQAQMTTGQQNLAALLQTQGLGGQLGLQAALANQQAGLQVGGQNLAALLQTQGLGGQLGLQAALANQQAGLTVGGQNLAALLQTQGLGAQLGMQSQLANQSQGLQAALANQQALEFGAGQQMQASLANQQAGLQAALANQQAGLQAGLAAQQMGLQGAEFNAGQGLQAGLANQAAGMQALGLQYQGGLQGALQTQQLGLQGQMAAGQLGLTAAQQQEALRQAQQGINLQGTAQQAGVTNQLGNLDLSTYYANLSGLGALSTAAQAQQGYAQQLADTAYQNQMAQAMLPIQMTNWNAALMNMMPLPYANVTNTSGTQTTTTPGPSIFSQILGGALAAGSIMGGLAEGGLVNARKPRHSDAAADRKQVLGGLRDKNLIKHSRGGLAAVPPRRGPTPYGVKNIKSGLALAA
jgi:hypothetical protein